MTMNDFFRANYHTHTSRCKHAAGCEEEYVQSAIQSDVSVLGFSDHAPFPDRDFGLRMAYGELDDYLDTIAMLSDKYSAKISLLKGLEIEYLPEYHAYYEELLTKKHLDYLLLGEHFFKTDEHTLLNIYNATDTDWYPKYAAAIADAIKTGYFRILAHPDLCMLNPFAWDKNCEIAADCIINAAMQSNIILEFNANGIRRGITDFPDGKRYPYPDERFWQKIHDSGLPVIVNSDCHNPAQVWDDALDKAHKLLRTYDIEPILQM